MSSAVIDQHKKEKINIGKIRQECCRHGIGTDVDEQMALVICALIESIDDEMC